MSAVMVNRNPFGLGTAFTISYRTSRLRADQSPGGVRRHFAGCFRVPALERHHIFAGEPAVEPSLEHGPGVGLAAGDVLGRLRRNE